MTKIRQDCHSLYVRAGGYLFRPVYSYNTRNGYSHVYPDTTICQFGDVVKAHHIACTPMAKITLPNGTTEIWFSHGSYYDTHCKIIRSIEVWCP